MQSARSSYGDIRTLLRDAKPRSVLAVGQEACQHVGAYREDPHCHIEQLPELRDISRLSKLGAYDVALVAGVLERLARAEAAALIAAIRDLHARRAFFLVPIGPDWEGHASRWEQNDLFGYGMRFLHAYGNSERPVHLYEFDISTYKATPDWLNPKFWAHPELFGKFRW